MSGRRFRDQLKRNPVESDDSALAHENMRAINSDLRRRISTLENSTSFRIGRLVLKVLQPLFAVLRIRRFSNRAPKIEFDSFWPRLTGRVTVFQLSFDLIPVTVTNRTDELLSASIDPATFVDPAVSGPFTGSFDFHFPLGFHSFDESEMTVRFANEEVRPFGPNGHPRILRPIEVAIDSIIEIRGNIDQARTKLADQESIAVVSTYRSAERISAVPHRLVSSLRDEGFIVIVVDTSETLPDSELECDLMIHRRNIGWDFASWMSTLARFPWIAEESKNLLLINDSNVGPLHSLRNVFEAGRSMDADIWGLTDSWDITHHLQSYFIHFNTSALRSGFLQEFVESFTFPTVKDRIIGAGELGLTSFMRSRGSRIGVLFPYTRLAEVFMATFLDRTSRVLNAPENRLQQELGLLADNDEMNFLLDTAERIRCSAPVNPTHYFWDILLEMGSPFVKRDLLVKNPDRIAGLHRLPSMLHNDDARAVIAEEVGTWPRTHPDMSLPLALHWQPPAD